MGFDKNSYETPDREAALMAKMVLPTDELILEPFAGTGQLVKAIIAHTKKPYYGGRFTLPQIVVNELSPTRFQELLKVNHCEEYYNRDFFTQFPDNEDRLKDVKYDLIMTNPPFDPAIAGIKHSLTLLNDKPESRLLWLLPLSFFSSQGRSKEFAELDAHIESVSLFTWRLDYLKDGIPMSQCQKEIKGVPQFKEDGVTPIMNSGRQESDAVFCIKKGKRDSHVNFLF